MKDSVAAIPSIDTLSERFVQHLPALNADNKLVVCQTLCQDIAEH